MIKSNLIIYTICLFLLSCNQNPPTIPCISDTDNDGVCLEFDVCDGYDDNLDEDSDGIPDGCDECLDNPANNCCTVYQHFTNCNEYNTRGGPSQNDCDWAYGYDIVNVSYGIQYWIVPESGTYTITAVGAGGGESECYGGYYEGRGAVMIGDFDLVEGQTLKILVGHQGENECYIGGGGGGTFVADSNGNPLIVAGGGAGEFYSYNNRNYTDASTSQGGQNSPYGASGGSNGSGGNVSSYGASGGGGFYYDGYDGYLPSSAGEAFSYSNYGYGGYGSSSSYAGDGGFGGGGGSLYYSSSNYSYYGSGGGGGYSGGAGGHATSLFSSTGSGGGGGSYNSGVNQDNSSGANSLDGWVTISCND
tara:strand:- start:214 stop:1296 length:1083 start_codon:yes stop_codon:yes gene_type:complete